MKSKSSKIQPHFQPNKLLAVNKSNADHNEIKTRMTVALKTNALHLNQMNIDKPQPEIFKLLNLVRLDLSYNNIVKLSPDIAKL